MPFLELFDETLDINSTEHYELSLQMSPDGFAFTILDTIRNKYVLLRATDPDENKYLAADKVSEIISKDDFLNRHYKKVNIVIPSSKFTLVPSPLFDPGKKEEYFRFNFISDDHEVILSNRINDPDAWILFSVPEAFYQIATATWPASHPFHHSRPLLNQASHAARNAGGRYVHIHVEREFFNIFIYDKSNLTFSNTFNYRNISDIMYYVLNVFRSMNISSEETIHFSGQTEMYDDLYSNFAIYIRSLMFTEPSGNFTWSYVFNDIELHRYINLFTATNCE